MGERPNVSNQNASRHPYYGGCDGFGPLGMCSECTGVIHCDDGSFSDNLNPGELTQGQAADRVREFLMREAECAAFAAAMHTSEPRALSEFVGAVMADVLPRNFDSCAPVGDEPF